MPNYQLGQIYMVYAIENPEDRYYGSTIQPLYKRFFSHKTEHFRKIDGKQKRGCSSSQLFEKYGEEGLKIELVEKFPCNSKDELEAREGHYIRTNICVNKLIAGRTKAQYLEDNREEIKAKMVQYREDNREEINAKQAQYNQDNREKINAKQAQYNQKHREEINAKRAQYRETHREEINRKQTQYQKDHKEEIKEYQSVKITCQCGSVFGRNDKARHERSKKHIDFISNQL